MIQVRKPVAAGRLSLEKKCVGTFVLITRQTGHQDPIVSRSALNNVEATHQFAAATVANEMPATIRTVVDPKVRV